MNVVQHYNENALQRKSLFKSFFQDNYSALMQFFLVLVYYVIGVIFYHNNMGWNVLDCVYFITVSITTVGY
jgi:hypothetical protein